MAAFAHHQPGSFSEPMTNPTFMQTTLRPIAAGSCFVQALHRPVVKDGSLSGRTTG